MRYRHRDKLELSNIRNSADTNSRQTNSRSVLILHKSFLSMIIFTYDKIII